MAAQLNEMLSHGEMKLRKWSANSTKLLEHINKNDMEKLNNVDESKTNQTIKNLESFYEIHLQIN